MSQEFVLSYEHIETMSQPEKALELLKRVTSFVKPIMRKHQWTLPTLAEFFPEEQNLLGLNINRGQKILIRLRPHHSPSSFFPVEDLVGTMLHELTHNVHGPHDDKFYKFLDGLQDEYEALQRSGYAGEGFYSEGKRLGGSTRDLPLHIARQKAADAAQKRIQTGQVLGGGGRRLGGSSRRPNLSPREMAARAAERRIRDELACGSGKTVVREGRDAPKSAVRILGDVIDLTLDDPNSIMAGPNLSKRKNNSTSTAVATSGVAEQTHKWTNNTSSGSRETAWECTICTLLNESMTLVCDACGVEKPAHVRTTWGCLYCGEQGMEHDLWTCLFCGQMKVES